MKLFEFIVSKGTFIENINKTVGANTNFSYHKGEKGLSLKGTSGEDVIFSQTLTGVKTIIFSIRKNIDSEIFKDNATNRLEISSGNISGTGLTQNYVDGVDTNAVGSGEYHFVIAEFSSGIDFATNIKIAPSSLIYLADKIVFYDALLSEKERSDAYRDFLSPKNFGTALYPRYNPHSKPSDLSNEVGLVAAWNMIPGAGGVLTDISGNGNNGTITGAISSVGGMVFNGTASNEVNFSNINLGKTYSLCFRVKPKVVGGFILNGTGNDDYVFLSNSTTIIHRVNNGATASFTVPAMLVNNAYNIILIRDGTTTIKCYVNGVQEGSDQTIGSNDDFEIDGITNHSSLFYNGEYIDFKAYNYAFTEQQVKNYSNSFSKRIKLIETFELDPISSTLPQEWIIDSGTFALAEDSTSKYISCTGNGTVSIYVDLTQYFENGFIKQLLGDLTSDAGDTVNNATNVAYAAGKLTLTMTNGQKVRNIIITQAEEQ